MMPPEKDKRAVIITGCSSGIGKATAIHLAKNGFLVLASVRKAADVQSLEQFTLPNLIPLYPLDLTKLEQIEATRARVLSELENREISGLYALINNAGSGSPAPIEVMNLSELERELKTRIVGAISLVQNFLPLLRKGQGRIIWIMTPAAKFSR